MLKNEDYVSLYVAKLLKEKGYNKPYLPQYINIGTVCHCQEHENFNESELCFSRPTLYEAQKWLREVKNIDVLVWNCACGYGWEISKAGDEQTRGTTIMLFDDRGDEENSGNWPTYESALSAGLERALKLIK